MLSSFVARDILTYFSIFWRSEFAATLFVDMMMPLLSAHIKSVQMLDLMLLRAQLILITYEDESLINLLPRSQLIGTITCLQDKPLVVMLSLGLALLLEPLMTFWIESILLLGRLGNVPLIFKVFITILEDLLLE